MKVLILTGMYPTAGDPVFGCFVADQVEALRDADPGLECDVLFFDGRASRLNYARAAGELRRRLRAGGHDLVHAHYGLAGLVAVTQRRAPTVITLHGSDVWVPWQWRLSRIAVRRAGAVIAVCGAMERLVREAGARDVHVIPCGVDLERFRPVPRGAARRRLGWPAGSARRVLFPGDPARPVKGHDLFRRVLGILGRSGIDVEEVTLAGVPPRLVADYMNACDLLLMTSRSEGSPMAIKEAMACNLPIVSVDVGDVAQLVGEASNCAVVSRSGVSDPAAALADACLEILCRGGRSDGRLHMRHLAHLRIAAEVIGIYRNVARLRARRRCEGGATASVA